MKTDDLVTLLATGAAPVPRHAARRRLALALAAGLPVSLLGMLLFYGTRPGLADSLGGPMAWMKILLPAAVAAGAFAATQRLARPGARLGAAAWIWLLPIVMAWTLGAWSWSGAAPADRNALLWGTTWRTCVFSIVAIGTPVFVATLLALRDLAPTRPALAGAAAGLLAGGAGAAVYALHCPELGAPFLAVWYVLGVLLSAVLGAGAGRVLLRW